jgi:hypothetical protein
MISLLYNCWFLIVDLFSYKRLVADFIRVIYSQPCRKHDACQSLCFYTAQQEDPTCLMSKNRRRNLRWRFCRVAAIWQLQEGTNERGVAN